jgi:17beta-estradiol 17-dehydrogenase / very-long-chain 3-oxoacyl-CoA reductase
MYVVVTGSTDGIGKEFAKNLAKQKFNLILVSRTMSKLETVKAEIEQQHKVEVKIYSLDFSRASNSDMNDLKDFIKDFPVTVLGRFRLR